MFKRFWLIGEVDADGKIKDLPYTRFGTESQAKAYAESYARQNVGKTYVLLEATDTVRKSDIAWEPCYDILPF